VYTISPLKSRASGSHGKKMAFRHSSFAPVGSWSSHRASCVLAHALRPDHDVVQVEVDVRERGEELGVEPRRPLVALPARAGARDRVDAVLRQRGQEARQVPVVLGDGVDLPELADRLVLVGVRRAS
jgi:hypothetical protein